MDRLKPAPPKQSELRSDWQAEARPTKAVRAALRWTGRRPIPQCSDEESMSCEEVSGELMPRRRRGGMGWETREQTCPHERGMAAWKGAPRSRLPERKPKTRWPEGAGFKRLAEAKDFLQPGRNRGGAVARLQSAGDGLSAVSRRLLSGNRRGTGQP